MDVITSYSSLNPHPMKICEKRRLGYGNLSFCDLRSAYEGGKFPGSE